MPRRPASEARCAFARRGAGLRSKPRGAKAPPKPTPTTCVFAGQAPAKRRARQPAQRRLIVPAVAGQARAKRRARQRHAVSPSLSSCKRSAPARAFARQGEGLRSKPRGAKAPPKPTPTTCVFAGQAPAKRRARQPAQRRLIVPAVAGQARAKRRARQRHAVSPSLSSCKRSAPARRFRAAGGGVAKQAPGGQGPPETKTHDVCPSLGKPERSDGRASPHHAVRSSKRASSATPRLSSCMRRPGPRAQPGPASLRRAAARRGASSRSRRRSMMCASRACCSSMICRTSASICWPVCSLKLRSTRLTRALEEARARRRSRT